jgi:hypothetical protein
VLLLTLTLTMTHRDMLRGPKPGLLNERTSERQIAAQAGNGVS